MSFCRQNLGKHGQILGKITNFWNGFGAAEEPDANEEETGDAAALLQDAGVRVVEAARVPPRRLQRLRCQQRAWEIRQRLRIGLCLRQGCLSGKRALLYDSQA